jgi:hypothetical protein
MNRGGAFCAFESALDEDKDEESEVGSGPGPEMLRELKSAR